LVISGEISDIKGYALHRRLFRLQWSPYDMHDLEWPWNG